MRETLPKAQAEVAEVRSTAAHTYTQLYTASHPLHTLCTSASLHAAAPLHLCTAARLVCPSLYTGGVGDGARGGGAGAGAVRAGEGGGGGRMEAGGGARGRALTPTPTPTPTPTLTPTLTTVRDVS